MKNKNLMALGLAVLMSTTHAFAGESDTVNRAYAGLKWTTGQGYTPAIVVGYRSAKVESNGHVDGGDVSMSFNVFNGFGADKLRVKYLNGNENIQGEVGGGYDFSNGLFAGASLQGPYVSVGADYLFKAATPFEAYAIAHTHKKYDKPKKGAQKLGVTLGECDDCGRPEPGPLGPEVNPEIDCLDCISPPPIPVEGDGPPIL